MIPVNSNQTIVISVDEARKIMGEANKRYSDTEVKELIIIFTLLSDIAIDNKVIKNKNNLKMMEKELK